MAKRAASYAWSAATTIGEYQTELDGLLDAIAAMSTGWVKTLAATIYDTNYVYGVVKHSTGLSVAFAVGTDNDAIDPSNLGESSDVDDRIYVAYVPQRGAGYGAGNPRTVDWVSTAGGSPFFEFVSADMQGAAHEFNIRGDDDAGLLLLTYEAAVGTPLCYCAISGSSPSNSLYRTNSIEAGDANNDFMLIRKAGNLAYNDNLYGVVADSAGDFNTKPTYSINADSISATYNPAEPWFYVEASVFAGGVPDGLRGVVDLDWFGHVREGAVSSLTSLESGAFEHITDGLVWVDP
ncbi:MAG: hypothetical protein ACYTFG_19195 [Planctomycetota bacterium]|jgi:hypothetical protein